MGKKILATVVFLALIGGIGYYLYKISVKPATAPATEPNAVSGINNQPNQNQIPAAQPQAAPPASPTSPANAQINVGGRKLTGTFSAGEGDASAPNIQVVEVNFDGSQFAPAAVDIHVNDWVFFKNTGNADFWPASNPHPAHTDYPGFDARQNIAPGGEYKFQFTKAGHWGYHDHLNPAIGGVVNVSAN